MEIQFDPSKNQRNIRERDLSFLRVATFNFSTALIEQDKRKPYTEARYIAIGYLGNRLHVLVFSETRHGIRVISFRKANAREVRYYETRSAH